MPRQRLFQNDNRGLPGIACAILITLLTGLSCSPQHPTSRGLSPTIALIEARETYTGKPDKAIEALHILEQGLKERFYQPAFRFGHEICTYHTQDENVGQACDFFYQHTLAHSQQKEIPTIVNAYHLFLLEQLETQNLRLANQDSPRPMESLCSQIRPKIKNFEGFLTPKLLKDEPFILALRQSCYKQNNKESIAQLLAEMKHTKAHMLCHKLHARAALVGDGLQSQLAMHLFRRGFWLLEQMRLKELKAMLDNPMMSKHEASAPVRLLLESHLLNPFHGISPYAKTNSLEQIAVNLATIERKLNDTTGIKKPGKQILLAETYRLHGELAFMKKKFTTALGYFEQAIQLCPRQAVLLENLILTSSLTGNTKILDKYSDEIAALNLQDKWNAHLINNLHGDSDASQASTIKLKKESVSIRRAQHILQSLVTHPFLQGSLADDVEIREADDNNLRVQQTHGKNYLIIGSRFMKELESLLRQRGELSEENLNSLLAVVIGHELHHLRANHGRFRAGIHNAPEDYMIPVYREDNRISPLFQEAIRSDLWQKEFEADEMGLFYAFLAGYRANTFLALLYSWHDKNPVQPILPYGHPPNQLRLKHAIRKIKHLQVLAHSFNQAMAVIRNLKQNMTHSAYLLHREKNLGLLAQAENLLEGVHRQLPDHKSSHINLSFLRLMRLILSDPGLEVPVYPLAEENISFAMPMASDQRFAFRGQSLPSPPEQGLGHVLTRYRPSLAQGYPQAQALIRVAEAIEADLEKALRRNPDNQKIKNNLALALYWQCQIPIRSYLAAGTWPSTFSKQGCSHKLKRARQLLHNHSGSATAEAFMATINLAAIHIAGIHLRGEIRSQDSQQIQSLFLFQAEKSPDQDSPILFRSPFHEWLGGRFIMAYLKILDLSVWEHLMSGDLQAAYGSYRKKLNQTGLFLSDIYPPLKTGANYWQSEVSIMHSQIELRSKEIAALAQP